jgi:hypothetical protein
MLNYWLKYTDLVQTGQAILSGRNQWRPGALERLILAVHSPFLERLNKSLQGLGEVGDTSFKYYTISISVYSCLTPAPENFVNPGPVLCLIYNFMSRLPRIENIGATSLSPNISRKKPIGPEALVRLILMVYSVLPQPLNQSRKGMVEVGESKPEYFTISISV